MKTSLQMTLGAVLWAAMFLHPATLLAQGSLTPPGPPAPTMKTLQQVEPRTPISSAPFTISVPGPYYLTTNLTVSGGDAITIATNEVTLDLNGFTIRSTANPAAGTAVLISGPRRNITIQNGFIRGGVTNNGSGVFSGPGFGFGIYYSVSEPQNVRVSGVSVSGCTFGIYLANGIVENCMVHTIAQQGIVARIIRDSMARDCGASAIFALEGPEGLVSGSRGETVGPFAGITAVTALNCYGYGPSGIGLAARTAMNCYGGSSSGTGLSATSAQNCYGYSSSGAGLQARIAENCYGLSTTGTGLVATTAQNCYAESTSGPRALLATNAAFCVGHRPGGRAIEATIANGCWATAGTNLITHKYNMP